MDGYVITVYFGKAHEYSFHRRQHPLSSEFAHECSIHHLPTEEPEKAQSYKKVTVLYV